MRGFSTNEDTFQNYVVPTVSSSEFLRDEERSMIFLLLLSAVSLVLVVLVLYSKNIVRQSETAYPPRGQFINVEGIDVHYLDLGDGPALVVLHGSASSVHGFLLYLADCVIDKYRLILFDRPGFGSSQSMRETATIEAQNRLIHNMLKQLNVDKPILLGHSWSTTQAVGYALQYPEDVGALVLMSPGAFLDGIPVFRFAYWFIQVPIIGAFLLSLFPIFGPRGVDKRLKPTFHPIPTPEDFGQAARSVWMRPNSARSFIIDWAPQTFGVSAKDIQKRYGELQVPTVIVCGEQDQISPVSQNAILLNQLIPESELEYVEGAGHQVYVTHPHAMVSAIDRARDSAMLRRNQPVP